MGTRTYNRGLDDACMGAEPNQRLYNNDPDYVSAYNHFSRSYEPTYPEPTRPEPCHPGPDFCDCITDTPDPNCKKCGGSGYL